MNSENVRELFKGSFEEYIDGYEDGDKYEWCSNYVFGLKTYDGELDKEFVEKIFEVCKAILDRTTFAFINQSEEKYSQFIIVCNLFEKYRWIDWGTSIRGAWFEADGESKALVETDEGDVPFTKDNLRILIEFVEEADEGESDS